MTGNDTNTKETTMQTIRIGGVQYEIVRTREFKHGSDTRTAIFLRRPAGKRIYHAVLYENGAVSGVTTA